MIKRILIFTATIVLLFFVGYFFHENLIKDSIATSKFSVIEMYGFHAIASLVIYVLIELILQVLPNETGYLYLALMMIKMGVFLLLFQDRIFNEQSLNSIEKTVLIIPLFVFLIAETIGVARLLNASGQGASPTLQKKV